MKPQKTTLLLTLCTLLCANVFVIAQNSSAFVAKADNSNITTSKTLLDTSALNGNANMIMLVTHNKNHNGAQGINVDHPLGFRFQSMKWYLITQDLASFTPETYYNVFIPGDDAYSWVHTSDSNNIVNNYTIINDGRINNNPNAVVLVSNVLANYNDYVNGVFYNISQSKWCIYNQGGSGESMEKGIDFNIVVPKGGTGYEKMVHTADGNNTSNHFTYLNHADLNNNPDAIVFITQVWNPNGIVTGVYNNHNVGVEYGSNNYWRIYNEDLDNMPLGASFNVFIFKNNSIGIDEIKLTGEDFRVYPNPSEAGSVFTLEMDRNMGGDVNVEIYSLDGKMLFSTSFKKASSVYRQKVDTQLPRGSYVMRIDNNGKAGVQKLIIQ